MKFNLNKDVVNTARPVEFTPQVEPDQNAEVHETGANFVSLDQVRNDDKYVITSTWNDNVNQQVQLVLLMKKRICKEKMIVLSHLEMKF